MIRIGIVGYGNLGKGVKQAITKQSDMELVAIFSKRDVEGTVNYSELINYKDKIDVLILCGSSERDLRTQSPELSEHFNLVDSFDMHAIISDHVNTVDTVASKYNHTAMVSVGWDPGIFSLQKTIMESVLPDGQTQSFWGYGISQGHSDVAGRVEGVKIARSYSLPNQENIDKFKNHQAIDPSTNHHKVCYVVAEEDADKKLIEETILNTPHYFKGMSAEVIFIDEETMTKDHSQWKQAGQVIRSASTSEGINHSLEYSVKLDSNPEFTSTVLVAYARACYKMNQRNEFGAFTALDVRVSDMSSKSRDVLIKEML